jgi:hypothetical protein
MKEFFARLNPTERRFVVGVAVVFFLVVNIVWVWPHFGDWGRTRADLDKARGLLATYVRGTNQIPALEEAIAKFRGEGKFVPPENQILEFFRHIQNQAAASHVGIISMGNSRQAAAADNPFFVEQNQTIQLQSQEKELVDFLYQLGADPKSLIRVRVLSVQPDPPRQSLSTRVTLVASYQRKAPAPAASAAAPAPATTTPKPVTPAAPATAPNPQGPKPLTPNPQTPRPGPAQQKPPLLPPGRPLQPLTPNKK